MARGRSKEHFLEGTNFAFFLHPHEILALLVTAAFIFYFAIYVPPGDTVHNVKLYVFSNFVIQFLFKAVLMQQRYCGCGSRIPRVLCG